MSRINLELDRDGEFVIKIEINKRFDLLMFFLIYLFWFFLFYYSIQIVLVFKKHSKNYILHVQFCILFISLLKIAFKKQVKNF